MNQAATNDNAEHAGRLRVLTEAELTPAQQVVFRAIVSGPRGRAHGPNVGLIGPFNAWIRSPELADHAQKLGAHLRFNSSLPARLSELAILAVGHHMRASFEFAAHAPLAITGGLAADIVESLRLGHPPDYRSDDERLVHAVAIALLERHRIDDELYRDSVKLLGEAGIVELVALIGYYSLVSLTLNAFEVPLRAGMEEPFVR